MLWPKFKWLRRLSWLTGLLLTLVFWALLSLAASWAVTSWYNYQNDNLPLNWGVSWSSKQAAVLGLEDPEDLDQLLAEIPFKRLQLMSYWDEIETVPGKYDFDSLERQFEIAAGRNLKVSLQLGLHQSRWPRCYAPAWSETLAADEFKASLKRFISRTIERFDDSVNLRQYQLEPEIFQADESCQRQLDKADLGELQIFARELTDKEIALSRPNNWIIFRGQNPAADAFGLCLKPRPKSANVWQKIWQATPPAGYYNLSAGNLTILHPRSRIFIRSLVAEPRLLDGDPDSYTLEEIGKGYEPQHLREQLEYARRTNIKNIDLAGAEWWLWQRRRGQPEFWSAVAETVRNDF